MLPRGSIVDPMKVKLLRGIIGRNSLPGVKRSSVSLLNHYARHSSALTNTMFKHKVYMLSLQGEQSTFVVLSSELQFYVLNTEKKSRAVN